MFPAISLLDSGLFGDRAGFQNFIGDAKYLLGALFWDWFSVCPALNVAATKLAPFEVESFAAKKSYSFSFDFAKVFWCSFVVVEITFESVSDCDVSNFMEKSLMRELGHRIDGYLTVAGLCGQVSYVAQSDPNPANTMFPQFVRHISLRLYSRIVLRFHLEVRLCLTNFSKLSAHANGI